MLIVPKGDEILTTAFGKSKTRFNVRYGGALLTVGYGEGFRVPAGVRKPLMQEPTGHSRWLWGFRTAADVGDGSADGGEVRRCGQAASLRIGAVQQAPHVACREPVDDHGAIGARGSVAGGRSACG